MLLLPPKKKKTSSSKNSCNPKHKGSGELLRLVWVRPWITEERRQNLGQFSSLLDTHLRLEDPVTLQNYTRLTPQLFDEVLERVAPAIETQVTRFRQLLSPGLAVTLRHLATGHSYRSLQVWSVQHLGDGSISVPSNCPSIQR